MGKWQCALAVVFLSALPLAAFANPSPAIDGANFHWTLLAEVGVVFFEAMLLRWLLHLGFFAALKASALANAASFFLGAFFSGFSGFPFLQGEILLQLSDLYYPPQFRDMDDMGALISSYFLGLAILTAFTVAIETPVLLWLLRKDELIDSALRSWKVLLVNLISYPVFYTAVFLATVWRTAPMATGS